MGIRGKQKIIGEILINYMSKVTRAQQLKRQVSTGRLIVRSAKLAI